MIHGIVSCGPYRILPIECSVTVPFHRNVRKFSLRRQTDIIHDDYASYLQSLTNYLEDGLTLEDARFQLYDHPYCTKPDIICGNYQPIDRSYRMWFGPGVAHKGVIYKLSDNNISRALIRQTNTALAEDGEELHQYTREFVRMRTVRRFESAFYEHVSVNESLDPKDYFDKLLLYASEPHPKRRLRMHAVLQLENHNLWCHKNWLRKAITGKLKRFEWAKPGKIPRLICDLGVMASLAMGYAAKRCKELLTTFKYSSTNIAQFISTPDQSALEHTFKQLIHPSGKSHFACFSDDSCFAAHCKDGVLRVNLDISQCDATQTAYIFESIMRCIPSNLPIRIWLEKGLDQLKQNFTIPSTDQSRKIRFKVNRDEAFGIFLASGSTWTTLINTWANFLIERSLSTVDFRQYTISEALDLIPKLALRAGYKVTCEDASSNICKLQFLKHSPTHDGLPYLNLGVMLRSIGTSHTDLPGTKRQSFYDRACAFNKQLLTGMKHAGASPLYNLLAAKYGVGGVVAHMSNAALLNYTHFDHAIPVTESDICSRYNITHDEHVEMLELFRAADIGDLIRCRATDKIMELDYGLGHPTIHSSYLPEATTPLWWKDKCRSLRGIHRA